MRPSQLLSAWRASRQPSAPSGVLDFHGSYFEVGKLHGAALADEIRAELNPFLGWLAGQRKMRANQAAAWLVSRFEGLFRERMPHVLEEVHGISEGARLPYPHAFVAALRDLMPTDGCTAVACNDRNDPARPLISQTRDSTGPSARFRIMRFRHASGHSMVLLNYPGWIANTGLTSHGVSFAAFTLFAATPAKPNAPGSFFKRLVLEARSTAEVLEGVSGLTFPNGGYLVGDRSGHMVCIEMAAGEVGIRDVSRKGFVHGNRISSPHLKRFEQIAGADASCDLRQANMERILKENRHGMSIDTLEAAFRDHSDFPLSICRHNSSSDDWATIGAFVADLAGLEIHIAIGHPCTSPFVTVPVVPPSQAPRNGNSHTERSQQRPAKNC